MDNFGFCAISTAERARVACSRSVRRPTGAALQLRNSAQWNFWKAHGAPHRIIPAPPRASPMPILTPRIIRNGTHKRDTEEGASATRVQWRFG
jgi:hypothetical protein